MAKAMTIQEVEAALVQAHGATVAGKSNDGTRLHVWYKAFRDPSKVTAQAKQEAEKAVELGLNLDRFTGKLDKVWHSKAGDLIITVLVELERDKKFRSFNANKGEIYKIAILGE